MTNLLAVNEIFGPTFQGEGPSTGRRAVFLRLAMCNLKCTWCDTKYTWDFSSGNYSRDKEVHFMTAGEVARKLDALDPAKAAILVITGGEPMLQQKNLMNFFGHQYRQVEIETNGTIEPNWWLEGISYNVSPKLANSGNGDRRFNAKALRWFAENDEARFKFVISTYDDVLEVDDLVDQFGIPSDRVWLMPEGTFPEDIQVNGETVAEWALRKGFNFTSRLHVLLWGNTRGR